MITGCNSLNDDLINQIYWRFLLLSPPPKDFLQPDNPYLLMCSMNHGYIESSTGTSHEDQLIVIKINLSIYGNI